MGGGERGHLQVVHAREGVHRAYDALGQPARTHLREQRPRRLLGQAAEGRHLLPDGVDADLRAVVVARRRRPGNLAGHLREAVPLEHLCHLVGVVGVLEV